MPILALVQSPIFIYLNTFSDENIVNPVFHRGIQIELVCRSYRPIGWCFRDFRMSPTVKPYSFSICIGSRIRRTIEITYTDSGGIPRYSFNISQHYQSRLMTCHLTDMVKMNAEEIKFLSLNLILQLRPRTNPPALRIPAKRRLILCLRQPVISESNNLNRSFLNKTAACSLLLFSRHPGLRHTYYNIIFSLIPSLGESTLLESQRHQNHGNEPKIPPCLCGVPMNHPYPPHYHTAG